MPLVVLALSLVAFAGPRKNKKAAEAEETVAEDVEARPGPDLGRHLRDVAEGRLDRTVLCRELAPLAAGLKPGTRATLKEACPSFFPVPAPPTFCRIDPCVTDVPIDAGPDRRAEATR